MPVENIIILLAAWITSLGLLGVLVLAYAQAEAAQEKLASDKPTRAAAHRNGRMVRLRGKSNGTRKVLGRAV